MGVHVGVELCVVMRVFCAFCSPEGCLALKDCLNKHFIGESPIHFIPNILLALNVKTVT